VKDKNDSLRLRIQELEYENDDGREALGTALQTNTDILQVNDRLTSERNSLGREKDDLLGQREGLEHTVSMRDSQIQDHVATTRELETRLDAAMERVHQYEFRNDRNTSAGGEDSITSLANQTADLQLHREDHTSTLCKERLKQLEAEMAPKRYSGEAAIAKLQQCSQERIEPRMQSMRLRQRVYDFKETLSSGGKDDECEKDCEELKRRLCKLARIVTSHNRALDVWVEDLMTDVKCDKGCKGRENEEKNKEGDDGGRERGS
jgi:chromosome segregation ATPase